MNVLIIGYSSIVNRRVLPALVSLPEVNRISIASSRSLPGDTIPVQKRGDIYKGYSNAFLKDDHDLAYISLPNSMHAEWAKRALNAGMNVIVDKPAFIEPGTAEELVEIANGSALCIAEANVWGCHPIAQTVRKIVAQEGGPPLSIAATFTSPPLDSHNFRYNPELGSGVMLDRGPYAISCGRLFFESSPVEVFSQETFNDKREGVDISFNTLMVYPGGNSLIGFFSLEAEYCNRLSIVGSSYRLDVERIFTTPVDYCGKIYLRKGNSTEIINIENGDSFALFISDVIRHIKTGNYNHYTNILVEDATVLSSMKNPIVSEKI